MSISAYVGLPGSGKSYQVVKEVIIPALKQGRKVYTNIPLNDEIFKFTDDPLNVNQFEIQDIKNDENFFFNLDKGCLLVFDEIHKYWRAGLKVTQLRDSDIEFLSEHRHIVGNGFSTEIVLVTQDLSNVSSYIKTLIDRTYRSKKLSSLGLNNRFNVSVFNGSVTGLRTPKNQLIKVLGPFKYDKDYYKYYISQTKSEDGLHGQEAVSDSRFSVFSGSGKFKFIFIFLGTIFSLVFVISNFKSFITGQPEQTEQPIIEVQDAVDSNNQPNQVNQQYHEPEFPDVLLNFDLFISWNNVIDGHYRYSVQAISEDTDFMLDESQLLTMNYEIQPISQCFLLLKINSTLRPVGCPIREIPEDEEEADPIDDMRDVTRDTAMNYE